VKLPKILGYPFWVVGTVSVLVAVVGLFQVGLGLTDPVIAAYCNVGGFVERSYTSFDDCQNSLAPDIKKYGFVCGCRRTDGVFGLITRVTRWIT